jgi:three-Cys-motif partner protein
MANSGKPITPISLLVNDNDTQKLENVKSKIDFQDIADFHIEYHNKDANEMFDLVATRLSKFPKDNRNLIFIDPYGYSDIKKDKITSLLKNNYTEIVLFLPVMHMYRFIKTAFRHEKNPHFENLRNFILSFFNDPKKINTNSIFEFIRSLKEAFSIDDTYFTCSHYIERGNGSYYALFFISSNIYGLEKMLETKWTLDPGKGKGFKQNENQMQLSMFDEEMEEYDILQSITTLENVVHQAIKQKGILTNVELYELTIKNEFLPKHVNSALNKLIEKKRIQKIGNSKGYGVNYSNYRNNIIVSKFEVL